MAIEYLLSPENVLDYGRMCNDVCNLIRQYYEDVDRIIIPSRGAHPIIEGAYYSAQRRSFHEDEYEDVAKFIEKSSLHVPLTADISIPEEYQKIGKDSEKETNDLRKFGSILVTEFFKDEKERKLSPYFNLFQFVLEKIENRKDLARKYKKEKEIESAILLDTVISGRALSTILDNVYAHLPEGKELISIGVVDRNMNKLREPYKSKLYNYYYEGKLELIPTKRIVTEDRGAGFLGISAIIYLDLKWKIEEISKLYPVGCVTWYYPYELGLPTKRIKEYEDFYKTLMSSIKEAIKIDLERKRIESLSEKEKENSKKKIKGLRKYMERRSNNSIDKCKNYNILNTPEPGLENIVSHLSPERVFESGAHVVHVILGEKNAKNYAKKFLEYYKNSIKN